MSQRALFPQLLTSIHYFSTIHSRKVKDKNDEISKKNIKIIAVQ
jgi:hypothetical protein